MDRLPKTSGACENDGRINEDQMGVNRSGTIGQILWIQPRKDGEFNVEYYCVPSYLPPGRARLPVRSPASLPMSTKLIGF